MAEIVKRGEFSNRPYKFIISGDEPNVDEQMRIDQVLREREFSFAKDYESKYGQQLTDEGSGVLNYLGEIPKGIARGGVGIFESALLGGAALLPEGAETSAREGIRGLAYALKPQADVGLEDSVAAKGSEALGSFAALGLTSLIPYAGPVAAGALAIGAGAGEASERARAAGATAEQRGTAALMGAPLGALDLLPIKFLGALGKTAATTIVNRLARAAAEGGVEGAQEAATTIAQNLIEQGVYNPEKGTFSDTGEALGYGAGVGALVQGLLDLLPGRTATSDAKDKAKTLALPAPGTLDPLPASKTPDVIITQPPPGAVSGSAGSNVPAARSTRAAAPNVGDIPEAEIIPDEAPIVTPAPTGAATGMRTPSGTATVSGVRRVTTGRATTTTVGLTDGTDLTLKGDATKADIDRAVSEYNKTKAAAAPIVTPAPTVTLADVPPAPKYKINKIVQKPTKSRTGLKYKTVATVEGVGAVEFYGNEKFIDKNDRALQPKVANALNPTQTNDIGIDARDIPPLYTYPEANASSKTVQVGQVGMDDVGFMPRGVDPVGGLFATTTATPATASTETPPAPLETPAAADADAMERALEERKIADAAAMADRLAEEEDAAKAQAEAVAAQAQTAAPETTATPAQGDFFGTLAPAQEAAPQAAPQATTQEATDDGKGTAVDSTEAGTSTTGGASRVGEGQGAGSDGQTPEVITASGTGGLASDMQSPVAAGATGGTESDTLAAVRDYFTPGNILESHIGIDRVVSFNVYSDGRWEAVVESVKKENGQWVPIYRPGTIRREGFIPRDFPNGLIERAKPVAEVATDATAQTATAVKLPMATVASASALDKPLSGNTRAFLEEGDLENALLSLSSETKNPILKALAKKFSQLVGTTRVRVVYPGDPNAVYLEGNVAVFWQDYADGNPERQNIIYIDGVDGLTAHALMHEMAHAVTVNIMSRFPNLPAMRQLQSLFESVRAQADEPGSLGYTAELYGLNNLREFVAEAYGRIAFGPRDNGLRDLMNNTLSTNIKYETNELPLTNYERFKEIIGNFFRGLVGMPSKQYPRRKITSEVKTTETGLDRFHQIMDGLLSPAPQILPGKIYNAAVSEPLIGRNVLNNAGKVPTWSPSAASRMYDIIRENIPDWLRNFALSLQQIDWIADFSRKALPVIDEIKSIFDRRQGESARLQKIVSQLPERYSVLAKANPAAFKRYIGILDTATRNQVDITKPRNTYKDDAGKLFIWDKLSKEMKAIDPDGKFREAYNIHIALNDSIRQEWFNAVTLQVNQTTEDPAERTALRDKLMAQLLESGIIDPYFPLMREGKYWVSYVQTETTSRPPTAPGVGTKEALFAPEAVVSTFESIGAARAFIAELNNAKLPDGRPAAVEITQEPFIMDFAKGYDKSVPLEFVQGAIKILDEIVPEASQREAGRAAIIEMFTRMSPAYSAMAQFRSRKDGGRAGAMGYESPIGNVTEPGEYIAALQNRLAGTVNAIVNSKFVPELEAAKSRLRAQAENAQKDRTNTLADKIAINATAKELEKRISFARNPTSSRVAYHGRGLTFLWTLGALPAATINVFFQMPMVVVPQLMGRHGSIGAITRAFNTARLISQSSGISQLIQEPGQANPTQVKELENWGSLENYYSVDDAGNFNLRTDRKIPDALRTKLEELAPLAQYMSKNGMLGTTIAQSELSGMGDVASRIYRFSGLPLQYAERFTRQSTAIAAFLLEQDKIRGAKGQKDYKLTPEEVSAAVKYAVDTTELTNGTVGILTGPSAATSGVGSILLMYKRYALSMLRFITNGVRRSLTKITPDMTPEQVADAKMERKVARYQLASMIGSTAIFAGIQGLPFFGEATTILDMLFTDDDEEDFKTLAQKSLQEPLYSGLVNYLTGAEVASRISMSGLVFRESPIQKDQSLLYDAFEMFGGPVLGTYLNVERGIGLVNDGEVYRGIEAMVPSSIRAFMRAGRYIEAGGAETMRGDQITPLDGWDVAVQLLGYTPEAVIRTQEAVGREKRITEAIRSEKNQLYKRFNLALVDGDYEEVRQVQKEMAEFMREHPELGGFDLKASARGFRQRSQDMIGGVYIPKPFQPGVRESLDEYGRE